MRLSSPAQTSGHLTEKRILADGPHAKAHSVPTASRKSAFCLRNSPKDAFWSPLVGQSAPFRETKLQTEICEPSRNPPRSLAGGLPHTSRAPRRDGKAHSAPGASRKSAFCPRRLTERRSLACLGITHRAFPRLLKPQNVSFRNSRLDCRRHDDAPRPPLDVVSTLTRRGRRGDAWRGVARGQGAAHVNDGLTESCPILRK